MRILFARLTAGLLLFSIPGTLRAASIRPARPTNTRLGVLSTPATLPRVIRPSLQQGIILSQPALPNVTLPRAVITPAWTAPIASPEITVMPAAVSDPLREAVLASADYSIPAEKALQMSSKIFDGKTDAPAVTVPEASLGPRVLNRAVRLIITGPPGSGKGTYSKRLSVHYGIPHISVGELLRVYARNHSDIAETMSRGELVDSSLVLRIVSERLRQRDVMERGFILDGFPRRKTEAAELQGFLGRDGIDAVISLQVPEKELLRRILGRGRADDTPEVFSERMRVYRDETIPAAKIFSRKRNVLSPDVSGADADLNYSRLREQFESWSDSAGLK